MRAIMCCGPGRWGVWVGRWVMSPSWLLRALSTHPASLTYGNIYIYNQLRIRSLICGKVLMLRADASRRCAADVEANN